MTDTVESCVQLSKEIGLKILAPDIDLRGKTVLVTGGAVGIGRALVEGALRYGAKKVVVVDIREDALHQLKSEFGDKVATVAFDLGERDPAKVEQFTKDVRRSLDHKLDIVFSNVGVVKTTDINHTRTLNSTPLRELDDLGRINATGNHLIYLATGDLLAQSDTPRYIATTSPIAGRADPATAGYALSKAGQEAYLTNLIMELKHIPGLVITAIDPGRVQTYLRGAIYAGEPLHIQPQPVDVIEPFLRAASVSADAAKLHGQAVIIQNTVANTPLEAGGKQYKVSERSAEGYVAHLMTRRLNAYGEVLQPLQKDVDTAVSRRLMGAPAAPQMSSDTLATCFAAPQDSAPASDTCIVLHDRDNNLVTEDVTFHAYQKLLKDHGILVPLDDLRTTYVGKRFEQALKEFEQTYKLVIGDETLTDQRVRFQRAYEEAVAAVSPGHLKTMRGVRGALAVLKAAGVRGAIVTNNSARVCSEGNALLGLDQFIGHNHVYSGDDIWAQHPDATLEELVSGQKGFKPAPDLYLMALHKEGVTAQHTIAVEDSISGIKAAKAAGIGTIVLNRAAAMATKDAQQLEEYTQQAKEAGATHSIDDYAELVAIVAQKAPAATQAALERVAREVSALKRGRGSTIYENAARVAEEQGGNIPQRGALSRAS